MIRMINLQANGWDLSDIKHIELGESELDRYRLLKGDLLFNRTNSKELVGKCEAFEEDGDWVFASYLIRVRVDTDRVLPQFVSAFLNCPAGRIQIDQVSRQIAGMTNVNAEELRLMEVPLPPIGVQHRLVAELDAASAERDRALAEAERLLESIDELVLSETGIPTDLAMRKVFSVKRNQLRGPLTPEPHAVIPLEKSVASGCHVADAGQLIRERVTPSKEAPEDLFAWIRIDDLENRPLAVTHIRTEQGKDIGGSLIPVNENDVLVARLGPTLLNAKIVLCPPSQRRMVASPEFLILRANDNWNPTFLRWLLRTSYYRTIMYARSRGGTPSRYRLDALDFLTIPLPRISSFKQIEIAEHCDERVQNAQALRTHAEAIWRKARERFEQQLLQGCKA